jgi:acylphosphatase
MKKAVKIIVKGTVQGVFFRNYIKEQADKLKIRGFVRNKSDSNVEIYAEGDIDNVDKFYELCKQGPKYAKIKEAVMSEVPFQDFTEFKILHI